MARGLEVQARLRLGFGGLGFRCVASLGSDYVDNLVAKNIQGAKEPKLGNIQNLRSGQAPSSKCTSSPMKSYASVSDLHCRCGIVDDAMSFLP